MVSRKTFLSLDTSVVNLISVGYLAPRDLQFTEPVSPRLFIMVFTMIYFLSLMMH